MRLADYVVRCLEEAGIGHVFTVVGGGSIFLNDALRRAGKIKYIACHHEQAAAMAAEAYARVRTHLGCVMVTSGPGGTNAITGIAGAWLDHVPVIAISGQVFQTQTIVGHPGLRTLGVQEINIIDLVRHITKYAVMVTDAGSIRFHLEKAIYLARHGRPGPVWLDIPADVQNAQVEPESLRGFDPHGYREADLGAMGAHDPDQVDESRTRNMKVQVALIVSLLKSAKRPLLHIGQGIRLAGAEAELETFMRKAAIPVVTARNGADLIDSDDSLYIGRPGTFAQRGANFAVQTCDLYLAIGTRLSLAQTGYNAKDYARNAKVIMVDIDRAELDKDTVRIDIKVLADAKAFLRELNDQSETQAWPDWSAWLARCKAWQAKYPPVLPAQRTQENFVNSYHLIEVLAANCTPDHVIITDMGFAFQNTHQAWHVKDGQRLMTNCGLAPMGWGLPAAIGAAIGSGRPVVLIAGDGGMMMNVQELATLRHHDLPVKIFLLNNGGYLTMRQSQAHAFDGYMGSDRGSGLSFPNFGHLAFAHGFAFTRLSASWRVRDTVAKVLEHDGPIICEIMMDPNQDTIPKSINRRLPDGTIKQTAIEDAWPYLPQEEIEEIMRCANSTL